MTYKETKRTKGFALFIFKTGFIISVLVLINIFPSYFAAAQDSHKPRVNLFEFSLNSTDETGQPLKEALKNIIMNKLGESQNIEEPVFISNDILSMLGIKKDYIRQQGIRYIIDGQMESLPGEQIRVKIYLTDKGIEGDKNKITPWERSMEKGLAILWFKKISNYIYCIIEGIPTKQVVFTYCFKAEKGVKDETVKRLGSRIHRKLMIILKNDEGFRDKYKLDTLELEFDCEKTVSLPNRIYVGSDYVISGIIGTIDDGSLEVTVQVKITEEGSKKLMEGFEEKKDAPAFVEKLARFIINQWAEKVEK